MSKKTTKVYLMVECEVSGFDSPRFGDHVEMARDIVGNALNPEYGVVVHKKDFTVTYPVLVGKPTVLPDDIKDILWRDSVKHLPLHEQLEEAVKRDDEKPAKERWQALIDRGAINERGEVLLESPWIKGESNE